MNQVIIYTDGGAESNPGQGGWGAVLIDPQSGREWELSGGESESTNNRMELTAAIESLASLRGRHQVALYTDSKYLQNGVTRWMKGWIARGWKRKDGQLANVDLWKNLANLLTLHDISWHWVKGHAGQIYNERADALASAQISQNRPRVTYEHRPPAEHEVFLKGVRPQGRAGWAALIRQGGNERTLQGSIPGATVNLLEILAAAISLENLPLGTTVAVYSASDYLRHGASKWLKGWRLKGWRTQSGSSVKNRDAWIRLETAMEPRKVFWPRIDSEARQELKIVERAAARAAR